MNDVFSNARHSRTGKMNWMPVTVFQPTPLVVVEKALLTAVAITAPMARKSWRDVTTKPRMVGGTISDW